jgi:hypothetical protein
MATDIIPQVVLVIGTLSAASIGIFGTYLIQKQQTEKQNKRETRMLAVGIAAEIGEYVRIMERVNLVGRWQRALSEMEEGGDFVSPESEIDPLDLKTTFPISFGNLDKLGSLEELMPDLARFFTYMAHIHATGRNFHKGHYATAPHQSQIAVLRELVSSVQNTFSLGKWVAAELLRVHVGGNNGLTKPAQLAG